MIAFPEREELAAILPDLTPAERDLVDLLADPRAVWTPQPGPQMRAYLSEADELFYGGSAGGGKTDLLLGLALTAHRRSIVFRREYRQLSGLVDRSKEIVGERGRFNGQDLVWRGLPGGRQLEFGAVQHPGDERGFQGRPHDLKAFDELANFLESQFRFLIGWTRTTVPDQRTRVACAGNPPTSPEGEWVVRYWAPWLDGQHPNPAGPGELRWFASVDGKDVEVESGAPFGHKGETVRPKSRTFVPARLGDNAFLRDTGYAAVLQGMPEPLRTQMLYGDFSVGFEDDAFQVVPTAWVRAAQERWKQQPRPDGPLTRLGVDVARGGKDKTVLSRRHGTWFAELEKHPGTVTPDGPAVAALVLAALGDKAEANVDAIGVGASAYDSVRAKTDRVNAVIFSAEAPDRDRTGVLTFANLRAYAYWAMREALDPEKGDGLALPPDPELLADLTAPRWSMRPTGVLIEDKEQIVKRIGRSPDCGDAAVLALLNLTRELFFA